MERGDWRLVCFGKVLVGWWEVLTQRMVHLGGFY